MSNFEKKNIKIDKNGQTEIDFDKIPENPIYNKLLSILTKKELDFYNLNKYEKNILKNDDPAEYYKLFYNIDRKKEKLEIKNKTPNIIEEEIDLHDDPSEEYYRRFDKFKNNRKY